jgi:hypothetical protein
VGSITKQLGEVVSSLTPAQRRRVLGYARQLSRPGVSRNGKKKLKRSKSKPGRLEDTTLGQLILHLEQLGDIGLPVDFSSRMDHYVST